MFRLRAKKYLKLVGDKVPRKFNSEGQQFQGITYHSKREAQVAGELELRKRAGDIADWERQVKIDLRVNGQHVTNYFVDFKVAKKDGSIEYVEVKGFETPEWKLKWRLFEILFGDLPGVSLLVVR